MSKYGYFFAPYFPIFGLNTENYQETHLFSPNARKHRLDKTPNSDSFHAVYLIIKKSIYREGLL